MGKLVATWVAVALSIVACVTVYEKDREPTTWELVCQQLDCTGVEEPQVIITKSPRLLGAFGYYLEDEPYIFVLPQWMLDQITVALMVPWIDQRWIIFHESVHYVLDRTDELTRCESEARARELTDKVFELQTNEGNWREQYGCENA